jgi:hypothetical protein
MNAKPLIAQCRRAYFALLAALGLKSEEDRHAFNLDNVGIESTRDPAWGLPQWLMAVSLLQKAQGKPDVAPGHPHLKGLRPDGRLPGDDPYPLNGSATRLQTAMIADLAARKLRDVDALPSLVRIRAFRHGQESLADQWRGTLATLPRDVASRSILILSKMPDQSCAAEPSAWQPNRAPRPLADAPF